MFKKTIIILFIFYVSCKSSEKCGEQKSNVSYEQTLEILVSLSEDEEGLYEWFRNLLGDPNFRILYDNPCTYKKHLMAVLSDEKQKRVIKYVALHALFKLCIEDYLDVLNIVYKEYKKGKLDDEILYIGTNQHSFSLELDKNYHHPKVRKLLKLIQKEFNERGLYKNSEYIDKILSGKSWSEDVDFYLSGTAGYIPWYCGSRYN